jgi:hypothetical protein
VRSHLDKQHRQHARQAARRQALDQWVQRIGQHRCDHEGREHRRQQPQSKAARRQATAR